jgi:TRAP transporter 4TM/12TM fusion protein
MSPSEAPGSEASADRLPAGTSQSPLVGRLIAALAIAIPLISFLLVGDASYYLGVAIFREQFLVAVFACALAMVFLATRADGSGGGPVPWYDALAAAVGFLTLAWMTWQFPRLTQDVVGYRGWEAIAIGAVIVPLALEGLRRTSGYAMFVIVLVFMAYAFFADQVPGQLRGAAMELDNFFIYLAFDPTAIFGSPMAIGVQVVIAFIFFGQILVKAGGGEFFTDIAMASMGRTRGGAAKIAVLGSCLFGTISGSAVSNVVSTGVITIPLMKRSGYTPVQAGAVEAVASTGGQFMPPVMGAAAFLMAEFLNVPYTDVVLAALIPALLYYFAVFVEVDLIAGRDHVQVVAAEIPRARDVLQRGWHLLVPFVVLLVAMFQFAIEPQFAALMSAIVVYLLGLVRGYRAGRLKIAALLEAARETGAIMVELFMILAAAGIVIGILNYTTLGMAFTIFLTNIGSGNLFVLLLISAAAAIVLGMGMPTSGIYVLLAPLLVPALVEQGVVPMGAHLFILYFGLMSMLTPPVALCAYAASSIARADAMRIGFTAMRFAWPAYVVPFLYAVSPTLLMQGAPLEIAFDTFTAFFGVYVISAAAVGFFMRANAVPFRLLLATAGALSLTPAAMLPGQHVLNIVGIALAAGLLGYEWLAARNRLRDVPVA